MAQRKQRSLDVRRQHNIYRPVPVAQCDEPGCPRDRTEYWDGLQKCKFHHDIELYRRIIHLDQLFGEPGAATWRDAQRFAIAAA